MPLLILRWFFELFFSLCISSCYKFNCPSIVLKTWLVLYGLILTQRNFWICFHLRSIPFAVCGPWHRAEVRTRMEARLYAWLPLELPRETWASQSFASLRLQVLSRWDDLRDSTSVWFVVGLGADLGERVCVGESECRACVFWIAFSPQNSGTVWTLVCQGLQQSYRELLIEFRQQQETLTTGIPKKRIT